MPNFPGDIKYIAVMEGPDQAVYASDIMPEVEENYYTLLSDNSYCRVYLVKSIQPINKRGDGAYVTWFNIYGKNGNIIKIINPRFVVEVAYIPLGEIPA